MSRVYADLCRGCIEIAYDMCRVVCERVLAGQEFQQILPQGQRWTEELKEYLAQLVTTREEMRQTLGLPPKVK